MANDHMEEYRVFLEHRRALIDAEFQIGLGLDKAILTLSAGALAVSMTFISEIVKQPRSTWTLIGAWIFFGWAIGSDLLSIYFCQLAYDRARKDLDAERYGKGEKSHDGEQESEGSSGGRKNCWKTAAKIGTVSAVVLFLVGLIFLGIFVGINLYTCLGESYE